MEQKRYRMILVAILVFSVAVRLGVAVYYGSWVPELQDDYSYSSLGLRLASGYGYSFDRPWYPFTPANTPTAHWSFLYTALVAAIYFLVGFHSFVVRLVGAILGGILLPWAAYHLAQRLFPNNPRVSLLTALGTAGYAYFVLFAARIMTETLYMVALLWSLERALTLVENVKRREKPALPAMLGLGLSLGIAALFRQAILPWVPVLFAWLLWVGIRSRQFKLTLRTLAITAAAMLLLILPFTVRNYLVYHDFLLLNSNSGYAMYSAQHPLHGTVFQMFAAAPLPEDLQAGTLSEAGWDRELMRRGIGFVLAEPGRYLLLSLSRVGDLFEFWPTDTSLLYNVGRMVSFTLFLPLFLFGIVRAVRSSWQSTRGWRVFSTGPLALALLFMGFYSLLHILTWAMPRYRLPVDAVAMPFAALSMNWALELIQKRMLAWQRSVKK